MPRAAFLLLLAACDADPIEAAATEPGSCVEPHLELWCLHEESIPGPDTSAATGACPVPTPSPAAEACGPYQAEGVAGGFTGYTHYFLDGAHVATKYWTDVDSYCGGASFWYGERVDCAR